MSHSDPAPGRRAPGGVTALVVGDANPDLVLTGDVVPRFGQVEQLLDRADLMIGGSAAITAHGLARLGRSTRLISAIGRDPYGATMADRLAAAGVDVTGLLHREDIGTGLTVVLAHPHDRAILTWPGAIATLTAAEVEAAIGDVLSRGSAHVHVASIFLQPGLLADLPHVLAAARAAGATTSVDTGDDPAGRWAVGDLLEHVDVLLPNRSEALALSDDADVRSAARHLAARGPLVAVKDGAAGALAVTPTGVVVETAAVQVEAVDTTGAGDTFDAAFLDGWLSGLDLATTLRRAARAGALAVRARGGTDGQPGPDELESDEPLVRTREPV